MSPRLRRLPRILFLLVPALLSFSGCAGLRGDKAPSPMQGVHPDGSPRYVIEVDASGRKNGLERWWHENGALKHEATWRAGLRDGVFRAWHENGSPWYEGKDSLGVPADTLRFWHTNGVLQSLSVFARGAPVLLETFDSLGRTPEQARAGEEARRVADSVAAAAAERQRALGEWAMRARGAVETYWNLPDSMKKVARRATANIRVDARGRILGVKWIEKSGSPEFDRRAARALAQAKRLPPLPGDVQAPLELRYEFTTPGPAQPRHRLQVRDPDRALGDDDASRIESPGAVF
jgi:TonB family protein